jgi:lipopolysaccharide transport system ATP-binding protein
MMPGDVLISTERLSKKFCKSLSLSLRYGASDVLAALRGASAERPDLRAHEFWALQDVSFQLRRGECLGLVGANGSGKSTLLKILNGLIKPDVGSVTIRGRVGALIELMAGFNPVLTGRENVYVNGAIIGMSRIEIDRKLSAIVDFAELQQFIDAPVQSYSSGMKVRLGFAVAAQMEPDILLIDEVLAVGDISFRIKCLNRISEILPRVALIFVSHSMEQIARVATSVLVLDGGRVALLSDAVAKGIDIYNRLGSAASELRSGSGQATVFRVRLSSQRNGSEESLRPLAIRHGDSLAVSFDVSMTKAVAWPVLKILLFRREAIGFPQVEFATDRSEFVPPSALEYTVRAQLPPLPLNAGPWFVSIVIADRGSKEVLVRLDQAAAFIVEHEYFSWASCLLEAHWEAKAQGS